jgi:hypothetical protein
VKSKSLAEVYPEVAATWHPERNGTLTPDQVTSGNSRKAWWRCPAGHEWEEVVSSRRSTIPKWKNGDPAACRECAGFRVPYTHPCGHMVRITPEKAARLAVKPYPRCWDCHIEWWETTGRAELSKAAKESAPEAADLIAAIPVQEGAPEPLAREWRWWAAKYLQGALGREAVGGWGEAPPIAEVLTAVTDQAAHLLPTKADAGRAAAETGVLRILDHAHWANGWLHHLTGRRPRPVSADELGVVAGWFTTWFGEWANDMAARETTSQLSTAQMTKLITREVGDLARAIPCPPPLRVRAYKEVRLPVVPPGAVRYGRFDTLICHPAGEIAVEIDSGFPDSLRSSAAKLAFARDAGAVPVWIRLDQRDVTIPDGVAVIDLRAIAASAAERVARLETVTVVRNQATRRRSSRASRRTRRR